MIIDSYLSFFPVIHVVPSACTKAITLFDLNRRLQVSGSVGRELRRLEQPTFLIQSKDYLRKLNVFSLFL